jgi:ATP-binding cassette subfamily B protein
MIKKLLSYAKGYGIYAFLSPLAIVFEVLIEVAIPFLMSVIVDSGINGIPLSEKDGFVVSILLRISNLIGKSVRSLNKVVLSQRFNI